MKYLPLAGVINREKRGTGEEEVRRVEERGKGTGALGREKGGERERESERRINSGWRWLGPGLRSALH